MTSFMSSLPCQRWLAVLLLFLDIGPQSLVRLDRHAGGKLFIRCDGPEVVVAAETCVGIAGEVTQQPPVLRSPVMSGGRNQRPPMGPSE